MKSGFSCFLATDSLADTGKMDVCACAIYPQAPLLLSADEALIANTEAIFTTKVIFS